MEQNYHGKVWRSSIKNKHFADNISAVRRLSCHIADNVNERDSSRLYLVSPEPRRKVYFTAYNDDTLEQFPIETDSNRMKAYYLNRRLLEWASIVNIGYHKKIFSVLFITLTEAEYHINPDIRSFLNHYRIKLKRSGYDIISYAWVLEFGSMGRNPHYHCAVVIDRVKGHKLKDFAPDKLGLWTSFVKTEFVRKDVVRYMCKYLQKGDLMVINHRRFGIARTRCQMTIMK